MMRYFVTGITLAASAALAGEAQAREVFYVQGHTGEVVSREGVPRPTKAQLAERTVYKGKASGITFSATYLDAGVGFNDPTHGANRKAVVNAVFGYLDSVLNHPGGACEMLFLNSQFDGTGYPAVADTGFFLDPPGFQGSLAFTHVTTGIDPDPGDEDTYVQIDFGYNWNNSVGPVGPGQFDLFTFLLHEVVHGLGVTSVSTSTGASLSGVGVFSNWDALLYRSSPSELKYWNSGGGLTVPVAALTAGDNTSIFKGGQANLAFGQYPPIHTPSIFESKVSLSHFQQDAPIPSNTLMRPLIGANVEIRQLHPVEIGALKDLGFSITSTDDWKMY